LSIRRLQTLVAFADTGSFALAAERVHLTPAAVGQQMKSLEEETGRELFNRETRVPTLNAEGLAMVPAARKLLRDYQALLSGMAPEEAPELTIGAVDTAMTGLVPSTLLQLRQSERQLHLRIVPGLSAELLGQVDRGTLDAAIISEPRRRRPHCTWRRIAVEPLVLITPPETVPTDPLVILEQSPFIRFSRNAWVGEQIDNWLINRGIAVRESMELVSLDAIYTMVSRDLGVSIVPDHCVPPLRELPLNRIPLGDDMVRVLGLAWRRESPAHAAIAMLAEILVSQVAVAGKNKK
jgi:DNA-binding transcriptional LysR family regulator